MHFDDYARHRSFVWYWYERLDGFTKAKLQPLARAIEESADGDLSQRVDAQLGGTP